MRYLHACFMILALPRIVSFITGILFFLDNKCELSSHGSPSWITNITMLLFTGGNYHYIYTEEILTILFALYSYDYLFDFIKASSETLPSSLSLFSYRKERSLVSVFFSLFVFGYYIQMDLISGFQQFVINHDVVFQTSHACEDLR